LAEPLGEAVGLLEAVSFKEATKSVCRGRTTGTRGYIVYCVILCCIVSTVCMLWI